MPYYNPFSPPKKDKTGVIVPVVIAVVIVALVVPMAISFYFFSMPYDDVPFDDYRAPMAFDSTVDVTGPTKADIYVSNFNRDPPATDFRVILMRDMTFGGTYEFPSAGNCQLELVSGQNVGTLYYQDTNNNMDLDPGDEISITNLKPDSFYEITIIYIPTGYEATFNAFSTPSG